MGKKDKNKFPAVDNSPPVSPYIDPKLQKKVLNELTRGFEWYFPSVHSPYGEFIARWYLPNSFKTLLKRRDNHLKKLKNPKETFKDILKNKVKQCEVLLSIIRDKWIEHDLELIDEMKTFIPDSKPDDTKFDPENPKTELNKSIDLKEYDTNEIKWGVSYFKWISLSKQAKVELLADKARQDTNLSYHVWHNNFKQEFPDGYSVEMGRYKKKFSYSNRGEQFAINGLAFYKKNR